jgi:cytochrome c-type biogenesis protein CcmH/NrfF
LHAVRTAGAKELKTLLFCLLPLCHAGAATAPLERALQEKIVAACCWNESIAVHRSETAAAMRAELKLMISQGLTEAQILGCFKTKYSSRVLIEPEGAASTVIYAIPVILTVAAGAALIWLIRRWLSSAR